MRYEYHAQLTLHALILKHTATQPRGVLNGPTVGTCSLQEYAASAKVPVDQTQREVTMQPRRPPAAARLFRLSRLSRWGNAIEQTVGAPCRAEARRTARLQASRNRAIGQSGGRTARQRHDNPAGKTPRTTSTMSATQDTTDDGRSHTA